MRRRRGNDASSEDGGRALRCHRERRCELVVLERRDRVGIIGNLRSPQRMAQELEAILKSPKPDIRKVELYNRFKQKHVDEKTSREVYRTSKSDLVKALVKDTT